MGHCSERIEDAPKMKNICERTVSGLYRGAFDFGLNVCFGFVIFYMIVTHVVQNIDFEDSGRKYRYAIF